ncbi:multidrug efflux pump RND permease subunit MdtB [uncultured Gammaproteobacteria bacterium]
MTVSELCIRRPIMTGLLSVAVLVAGIASYFALPVAALPRVDFPIISVSAVMPGASPEVMASSIAAPLEREFSTIAGVDAITSSSGQGVTAITLQFDLNRDIDSAAQDVQAALARAARRLPTEMTTPPSFRKVNPADQAVLLIALTSAVVPLPELNDYAENAIAPRVSRLSGVAQVQVYGAQKYAVRIQADPDALSSRGLSLNDVQKAIFSANVNTPVGILSGPYQQVILQGNPQLDNAEAYAKLVIAVRNGAPVRLSDVAKVGDSVENTRTASWFNGQRAIILAVQRQPDANTVEVVDRVKALLPRFQGELPAAASLNILNDRSLSIRDAVADVQFTLVLIVILVVLVIFLFLHRVSATIIPALAVPMSLVATFGGMYLLHFSIDNISLLGLTLSVGLVVDDAIVMLENIHRHIELGLAPLEAALKGSSEIGFTIISITISLIAVFIPLLAMGGVVGKVFFEFAMVVTLAIVASAVVSLTVTPMLCARFLSPAEHDGSKLSWFARVCEGGFVALLGFYRVTLLWVLRHKGGMVLVTLATIVGTVWLFGVVPKGFFPVEDTGQIVIQTEGGQDVSFTAMAANQQRVAAIVQANPHVLASASSVASSGLSNSVNAGRMFIQLTPRNLRPPVMEIIQELRRALSGVPGMRVYIQAVQNLQIGGRQSKSQYQYTLQSLNQEELYEWSNRMTGAMRHETVMFQDVASDLQINSPQAMVDVDRDKAAMLGVTVEQVRLALYNAFGTGQISTIYSAAASYAVILEVPANRQQDVNDLSRVRVRTANGSLVPVTAVATVRQFAGPLTVNHQSQIPSVTISFDLAPGRSLGVAVEKIRTMERELGLPVAITSSFEGSAQVFQQSQGNLGLLLAAAIGVIYVVLGVLYENLVHPVTILSGLPSAAIGALLTLMLFHQDLSIIAIIGILMLIGIVKKNAIMMIDFALSAQREDGLGPQEAITQACLQRFRPIMMTTMAAIMGTLPIAAGYGAAAELRQPLGLAVVGGLIVSQVLTLYITPVLYLHLDALGRWVRRLFA